MTWQPRRLVFRAALRVRLGRSGSRWRSNQSAAWPITASSAPGSGNRWLAPGTISSALGPRRRASACSLSSMTPKSAPPTINSVGARTVSSASPARSGRPPRETTAPTRRGSFAAATSAAAAPVLAPNNPSGSLATDAWPLANARHRRAGPPAAGC